MTLRAKTWFWVGTLAGFILFLWVFRGILLPFVAGMALAYLLDPVADRLQRWGLSRLVATITIMVVFVVLFILALIILIPVIANQFTGLIERLPGYIAALQGLIARLAEGRLGRIVGGSEAELQSMLSDLVTRGVGYVGTIAKGLWGGGQALIGIISLIVVTPVVAFYLLLDWDRMVAHVDHWVPLDQKETVRGLAREIDSAIAGFVRGQLGVCLILGCFYAVALTLIGLNFGLLIGLGAGLIGFVPFVGATLGLIVSLGVATVQFWPDWVMIVAVAAIFAFGQFVEGNVLQPRLVGPKVGLHPVWLMFALFAFAALFGFVGVLIAVPAAAAVGVLARFGMKQYLESPYYDRSRAAGTPRAGTGDRQHKQEEVDV